jgi:ketosteroid isomerase-like protein
MDDLQAMLIRDACRQLLMRYATTLDRRDMDGFVGVFADELEWKREGEPDLKSHADIREFFRKLYASRDIDRSPGYIKRHNFTTVCIEPVDEHTATGVSYAIVHTDMAFSGRYPAPMALPELVVEYHHVFRKTAQGWKIARHESRYVFRG